MTTLSKKQVYRLLGRRPACSNTKFEVFFDTIEEFNGNITKDFLIVRPKVQTADMVAGICVLPEVDGKIGLMRGYRHQLGVEVWQAPAGFVEHNETPRYTALRELEEEIHITTILENLSSLGTYFPDAGLIEGCVALFVARCEGYVQRAQSLYSEVGTGSLHFFGRSELLELINSCDSIGGSTLVACFRYLTKQFD